MPPRRLLPSRWPAPTSSTSPAQGIFTAASQVNVNIPDGSIVGVANSQQICAGFDVIGAVRLTLTVEGRGAGGFNGDLFAYLAHDGQLAIRLNRPGRTAQNGLGYGVLDPVHCRRRTRRNQSPGKPGAGDHGNS
jgi:hypothetical protein